MCRTRRLTSACVSCLCLQVATSASWPARRRRRRRARRRASRRRARRRCSSGERRAYRFISPSHAGMHDHADTHNAAHSDAAILRDKQKVRAVRRWLVRVPGAPGQLTSVAEEGRGEGGRGRGGGEEIARRWGGWGGPLGCGDAFTVAAGGGEVRSGSMRLSFARYESAEARCIYRSVVIILLYSLIPAHSTRTPTLCPPGGFVSLQIECALHPS